MLTSDLVRVTFRKGRIYPRRVEENADDTIALAQRLITTWNDHQDLERREWDEAVKDIIGDSPDFLLARGLAKLLDDRSDWESVHKVDPQDVRRALFEACAADFPVLPDVSGGSGRLRSEVVEGVAHTFNISASDVERLMYADRKEEQRLRGTEEVTPEGLLVRYNLSTVQAILLRATAMTIRLSSREPKQVRALFRVMKFHRLMHRAKRAGEGWSIRIDGPMSLFSQSQRYGLQMAMFFPSLLLLGDWEMEAAINWPNKDRDQTLLITSEDGFQTSRRSRGTWQTDEERMVRERFEGGRDGWTIQDAAEIIDLGDGDVLVPDFILQHKDGRRAGVEIVGYWRRAYMERRLERLRKAPRGLVMCVSRKLAVDDELADAPIEVIDYAQVIPVTKLVEAANEAAI